MITFSTYIGDPGWRSSDLSIDVPDSDLTSSPGRFFGILLIMGAVHVVILAQLDFSLPDWSVSSPLTVNLRKLDALVTPSKQDNISAEPITEIRPELVTETTETEAEMADQNIVSEIPVAAANRFAGAEILKSAVDAVRSGQFKGTEVLVYEEIAYRAGLPRILTTPSRVESEDSFGNVMVKLSDGNGGVTCIQERSDRADWGVQWRTADKLKNPSLFYVVKDDMCGHLD